MISLHGNNSNQQESLIISKNSKRTTQSKKSKVAASTTETARGGNQQSPDDAMRNITKMVIFTSFSDVLGTIPYAIAYILIHSVYTQAQINTFYQISLITLNLAPALDILIYYFFNRLFREVLKGYIRKIASILMLN